MSNIKCCSKHQEYREFNRIHYGTCFYCLLDQGSWGQDATSWEEITVASGKVTQFGFLDAKNGMVYKWDQTKKGKSVKDEIRHLYMVGVQMGNDELVEQPKGKNEIFPEGFDQAKYDNLVEICREFFDSQVKNDKRYIDIDTQTFVNPLPENFVKSDCFCASRSSKKVLQRIRKMIENEGLY
jgi:hypothetical protein